VAKSIVNERSLVVVGDRVLVSLDDLGQGTVEAVLPRRTWVSRQAPGVIRPGEHGSGLSRSQQFVEQVLAANIDIAAVVVALLEPRFKIGTVSQLLAGAQASGAAPLIVLNKVDLGNRDAAVAALAPSRAAGIPCVMTSALSGEGVEELGAALQGRWALLFGQSGVGKSSLLNAMCPEAAARTSAVSTATHWGRHTTTGSRVYQLVRGGYVVDSPGMRAFTFWQAPQKEDLAELFPEIAALAGSCKFADCTHSHEPGCAVKAAADAGEIDRARLRHYVRLASSEAKHRRR
jgi:ribosome biogenesis GTPase